MKYHINNVTYTVILLIYFISCLLFHEEVEKPFEWFVANYGNARLSLFLNIFFTITVIALIFFIFKRMNKKKLTKSLKWMGVIIFILSLTAYYLLMPYKSEGIHLLQYGIMAILSFLIIKNAWVALNFSYLLGIVDEGFQFIIGDSLYFDFNDIILNFLGSAIGILCFIYLQKNPIIREQYPYNMRNWSAYFVVVGLMVALIIFYVAGLLCIYPDDGCPIALHKLNRGSWSNNLLDSTHWGKQWHRIKAIEGIIFSAFLPLTLFKISHFRSHT